MRFKYDSNGSVRNISIIIDNENFNPTEIKSNISILMYKVLDYINTNPNHQSYSGSVSNYTGLVQVDNINSEYTGDLNITIYFNKVIIGMDSSIDLMSIVGECYSVARKYRAKVNTTEVIFRSCEIYNLKVNITQKVSFISCKGVNIFIGISIGNITIKESNLEIISDYVFSEHVYLHNKKQMFILYYDTDKAKTKVIHHMSNKASQLGLLNNNVTILAHKNTNSELLVTVTDFNINILNSYVVTYCIGAKISTFFDVRDKSIIINNTPESQSTGIFVYSIPNNSLFLDCDESLNKSIRKFIKNNYIESVSNITADVYSNINTDYI